MEGVWVIDPEPFCDERGFFMRSFCRTEFADHDLEIDIVQCNISYNPRKGTLRGMHYQAPPYEEAKIVSAIRGSIYDVVVDIRKDSPTYRHWLAEELPADSYRMLYIPKGCAHGFQTLEDDCVVYYQMGENYYPEYSRGIRWSDPSIGIQWPIPVAMMSEKDRNYPDMVI